MLTEPTNQLQDEINRMRNIHQNIRRVYVRRDKISGYRQM